MRVTRPDDPAADVAATLKYLDNLDPVWHGNVAFATPLKVRDVQAVCRRLLAAEAEVARLREAGPARTRCPCELTTPCVPGCSCVKRYSSKGCRRCCSYGSAEQRLATAVWLASRIDAGTPAGAGPCGDAALAVRDRARAGGGAG